MPARPSTWLLHNVFAVHACILHLALTCLTLSRAVWGRPQPVLIFWWVPALVQPLLVSLGYISVLCFLLHSLLFSPLSRFLLMCTLIFVLSSCIMAPVLNGFSIFFLWVSSSRVLWSSLFIGRSFLVLLVASLVEVTLATWRLCPSKEHLSHPDITACNSW